MKSANTKRSPKRMSRMNGFTFLELLVVLVIAAILTAIAVPNVQRITQALRIAGDLRDLNGAVAQAKMNAAADFTHARARANLALGAFPANTFQVEIWNKVGPGGGCWRTVGDAVNPCTVAASPVQTLSQGVSFGADNVGAPPPNTQTVFGQAAQCGNVPAGVGAAAGSIPNTACIEFNSRGLPVDATPGATWGTPYGNGAFYINNATAASAGTMVYALTVGATGYSISWSTGDASGNASWKHQ
jgi:prepilin-type N-terminal cleavage/methylation domain-containing protein